MESKNRVVIYSKTQDIESLINYSKSKGYNVVEIFEKSDDKLDLMELMDYITFNGIDKLIVSTCSTLSRKSSEFLSFINDLNEAEISLVILDNNIESLLPDGNINPSFTFLLNVLNEFNTIEKQQTRIRLERSYNQYRIRGGRVGRKLGYRKNNLDYKIQYWKEIQLLREGYSLKECKKQTSTSVNTLRKLKSMFV